MDDGGQIDLASAAPFRIGPMIAEPALRQVSTTTTSSETLQPRVMQVLVALARANGEIVSRDALVRQCWEGRIVGDDSINRVISRLRRLAEERGEGSFRIETIIKVGYRLVGSPAILLEPNTKPGDATARATPPPALRRRLPKQRTAGVAALCALVALIGAGIVLWKQPFRRHALEVASVRLTPFKILSAEIPAALPSDLDEAFRDAFGTDNAVVIKDARADYVMSGAVQRVGDKDHYSVRLQSPEDTATLWTFDVDTPAGAPVGPRRVAWEISAIVRCGLSRIGEYPGHLPSHAVGLYLSICGNHSPQRGIDLAHRLIAEAPDFSRAWSALSTAEVVSSWAAATPVEASALKKQAAIDNAKALDLDSRNGEAYTVEAVLVPPGRLVEREAAHLRSVAARASDCGCEHDIYGRFLVTVGRNGDANRQWERTLDMQPAEVRAQARLVIGYLLANEPSRSAEMLARFDTIMAGEPLWNDTHRLAAVLQRRWPDAMKFLPTSMPPDRAAALLAAFRALGAGDPATMAAAAPALAAIVKTHGGDRELTDVLAAVGARDDALTSLESEVALTSLENEVVKTPGAPPLSLYDPLTAPLSNDPRYVAVLRTTGAMAYWRATHIKPDLCASANAPAFCARI